ncbi:unnamed protein product, partial [Allacma fusca]
LARKTIKTLTVTFHTPFIKLLQHSTTAEAP